MGPLQHRQIASFYSLKAIQRAAEARGAKKVSVEALVLGNWLTDVSQLFLPLMTHRASIRDCLVSFVDSVADEVKQIIATLDATVNAAQRMARDASEVDYSKLYEALREFVTVLAEDAARLRKQLESRLRGEGLEESVLLRLAELALQTAEELRDYVDSVRSVVRGLENARAKREITDTLLKLQATLKLLGMLTKDANAVVETLRKEAQSIIDLLIPSDPSKSGELLKLVRAALTIWGYFQFVHPVDRGSADRMPLTVFLDITREFLAPSFAYEHSDRPPASTREDDYELEDDWERSTYGYLQQHRTVITGLLYEVDRDWAFSYFEREDESIADTPAWHWGLAKLGKALHAVQDFYSHTTFLEHACAARAARAPNKPLDEAFLLRLKRWRAESIAPRDAPDEPKLISGYYDSADTAISLLHLILGIVGFEPAYPGRDMREFLDEAAEATLSPLNFAKRRVREFTEIITDPQAAVDDITNELAQTEFMQNELRRLGLVDFPLPSAPLDEERVRELLKGSDFLGQKLDPRIVAQLATQVMFFRDLFRNGKLLYGYVTLVVDVLTLYRLGVQRGKAESQPARPPIFDFLSEKASRAALKYLVRAKLTKLIDALEGRLGGERIGSHSLIAKDEPGRIGFNDAMKLAMYVDAYIVSLMIRSPKIATSPDELRIAKWDEVMDYFLNHPLVNHTVSRSVELESLTELTIQITERNQTPTLVAQRFAASSRIPPEDRQRYAYESFDWKVIVDRNFATHGLDRELTQYIVNEKLKADDAAAKTPNGEYAFRRGSSIAIPYQLVGVSLPYYESSEVDWWDRVLSSANLHDIRAAFDGWKESDEQSRPLGVSVSAGFHTFSRVGGTSAAVVRTLEPYVKEAQKVKARLGKSELKARRIPESQLR